MIKKHLVSSRRLMIVLFSLGLTACSSQPIVINHYLLNLASPSTSVIDNNNANTTIIITDVLLPDHLTSRSLVMQTENGMLSIATKHVWAQPLDSDFGTLLANAISKQPDLSAFYGAQNMSALRGVSLNGDIQLAIVIEHFMPIASGDVVLTGHWQLTSNQIIEKPRRFEFKTKMEADGYIHSVNKMRTLVENLANAISQELAMKAIN